MKSSPRLQNINKTSNLLRIIEKGTVPLLLQSRFFSVKIGAFEGVKLRYLIFQYAIFAEFQTTYDK